MVSVKNLQFRQRGFTFVELLVVVLIVSILSAMIGLALWDAKAAARRSTCAFNMRQMGIGLMTYIVDYDSVYPQTKGQSTGHPEIDDNAGQIETPDFGSPLRHLGAYTTGLPECPADGDPMGLLCSNVPGANPQTNSFLVNGYFVWGLSEYQVRSVPDTVLVAERRSNSVGIVAPNCDVIFRPWFNPTNPFAPWNDMDLKKGAIATHRHFSATNYLFADNHSKSYPFSEVWDPDSDIDRMTP